MWGNSLHRKSEMRRKDEKPGKDDTKSVENIARLQGREK